ncbi:hypothetical protein H0H87_007830 [Tephrocybe sp. NHM501043]|nr:hypothetical protein H0H87_007830 [Tephrocybe sp. NHM501043]
MSAVLDPGPCFGANPDVSGIGVRIAIYAQNLLSFAPALLALRDKKVTPTELDALETQSTTILITAFAILVSTIVQARTSGISNYHTSIVLDLSWMNNTNLFIYLLLYTYRRVNLSDAELEAEAKDRLRYPVKRLARWIYEARKAIVNPVIIIGTFHLSLMASVGIWFWSNPAHFSTVSPGNCALLASAVVVGKAVPLGSPGLRIWSLLIYSVLFIPFFNLLIPVALLGVPLFALQHSKQMKVCWIMAGLGILGVIDVLLLFDTEWGIRKNINQKLLSPEEGNWTFGQTLALLLLLVPLRDLGEAFWERRAKSLGKRLLDASLKGELQVVKHVLGFGPQKDTISMIFTDSCIH